MSRKVGVTWLQAPGRQTGGRAEAGDPGLSVRRGPRGNAVLHPLSRLGGLSQPSAKDKLALCHHSPALHPGGGPASGTSGHQVRTRPRKQPQPEPAVPPPAHAAFQTLEKGCAADSGDLLAEALKGPSGFG